MKKIKVSKFMICKNPLIDDERVFILHSRAPVILVQLILNDEQQTGDFNFKAGNDQVTLKIVFAEDDKNLDKVFARMQDWIITYLNHLQHSIGNS